MLFARFEIEYGFAAFDRDQAEPNEMADARRRNFTTDHALEILQSFAHEVDFARKVIAHVCPIRAANRRIDAGKYSGGALEVLLYVLGGMAAAGKAGDAVPGAGFPVFG